MSRIHHSQTRNGFSLIELLVVLAIIATLAAISVPAVRAISGAGSVSRTASELMGLLESARMHAVAQRTYVRVGFISLNGGQDLGVVAIYDSSGALENNTSADLADPVRWPLLSPPRRFRGVNLRDALGNTAENTPQDKDDLVIPDYQRAFQNLGGTGALNVQDMLEFTPTGEARLNSSEPERVIRIPVDASQTSKQDRNPFVIRLHGMTGRMQLLRKEDL